MTGGFLCTYLFREKRNERDGIDPQGGEKDIDAVAAIYAHIHEQERTGKATIGWLPGIYPVRGTAEAALARENGCTVLRMDTNAKNAAARRLYQKLGYAEPDIVPCIFNGIPNVQLVLLEKKLT